MASRALPRRIRGACCAATLCNGLPALPRTITGRQGRQSRHVTKQARLPSPLSNPTQHGLLIASASLSLSLSLPFFSLSLPFLLVGVGMEMAAMVGNGMAEDTTGPTAAVPRFSSCVPSFCRRRTCSKGHERKKDMGTPGVRA